jgi:hypothetical protein
MSHDIVYMQKRDKCIQTEKKVVVIRNLGVGNQGDVSQRVQISVKQESKFWRSIVPHILELSWTAKSEI